VLVSRDLLGKEVKPMDIETIIIFLMFIGLQVANLVALSRGNGKSVNEAAKRAADSARKTFEYKMNKLNPWLKGFDPSKVQPSDDEMEE